MRKFISLFLEDVKVLAFFFVLCAAVYCGREMVSLIDFSEEKVVEESTPEDLFMQECMKRMESSKSYLQYHYGICEKELERKNK